MSLPKVPVHIRYMIRRDMPEVLAIENESYSDPWSDDDFIKVLRQRNSIGMVAEVASGKDELKIVGHMVYEIHKTRLELLNIAVDQSFRRRGVGRQMISKLYEKLTAKRRSKIQLYVADRNLSGQLFMRSVGFKATAVVREFFPTTGEDAYTMELHCREAQEAVS